MTLEEAYALILGIPVVIIDTISDEVFFEAGRLKSQFRVSLADAIALAEAKTRGAMLVTADHHEFDVIDKKENIKFHWIR